MEKMLRCEVLFPRGTIALIINFKLKFLLEIHLVLFLFFILVKTKEQILTTFDHIKNESNIELKQSNRQQVIAAIKDFIFSRLIFKYGYLDILQYLLC